MIQENREENMLKRGALSQTEAIFQALTHLGPAVGAIVVIPILTSFVGASVGLLQIASLIGVLLTGYCVAALARHLPSSGGFYTFVTHGLGSRWGFFTAWAYFLYDPLLPTLVTLPTAGILQDALKGSLGLTIPWWVIAVIMLLVIHLATFIGIRFSGKLNLILGVIEYVIMLALGLSIVFSSSSHQSLVPFSFPKIHNFQALGLAFAFGVLQFTGFESAAPLAEETQNPRKSIPRTVIYSILIVGVLWTLLSYAMVIGWGVDKASDIANAANPFFMLANRYWGIGWLFVAFALLNSSVAAGLAGQNAGSRVLFTLGRANILSPRLGVVHPKRQTPNVAITMQTILNLILTIGLGVWLGPLVGFQLIGLLITLGVLVVYGLGNISVIRLYGIKYREERNVISHLVVPILATLIILLGIYYTVIPLPPMPGLVSFWVVVIWLAIGLILSFYFASKKQSALQSAAKVMYGDDESTMNS